MIFHALLIGTSLLGQAAQEKVTLNRVFKKGELYKYEVHGHIQEEQRQVGLETFLPNDNFIDYNFTLKVINEKADGIVDVIYSRPNMVITECETYNSPEKKVKEPGMNAQLTLSPINEILDVVDLDKKKKEEAKKPGTKPGKGKLMFIGGRPTQDGADIIGQFTQTVFQLALFVGSPDSALDLNPKLPFDEIKVGATWKKTVGYSPQKLSGSSKSAVQRLDFVYTYKGMVEVDGKKFHRVTASLKLDTDAAEFINQSLGMKPSQSGLEHLNLKLEGGIDFDLRPGTFHTEHALAKTTGGYTLNVSGLKVAAVEVKLKGTTEMFLRSVTK